MKILLTFPGQGTQSVGMLHQLPESKITKQLLLQASEALNEDVMLLDSHELLKKTRSVQLCDLITSVIYAELLKERGVAGDMVCGLSIGAFPAAVVAGVMSFTDAIQLVSLRGQLMEEAYPSGYGMTSIQGLFEEQVNQIISSVFATNEPVYLANLNDEKQFVISGSESAMQKVATLAEQKGASRITRLAVSVPSHCPLLEQPANKLYQAIKTIQLKHPIINYLSSSSARVIKDPERIAEDLAFNMCRSVHWFDSMVSANERGITLAIEMPPGSVLTGLTKKAMAYGESVAISQTGLSAVSALVKVLANH